MLLSGTEIIAVYGNLLIDKPTITTVLITNLVDSGPGDGYNSACCAPGIDRGQIYIANFPVGRRFEYRVTTGEVKIGD